MPLQPIQTPSLIAPPEGWVESLATSLHPLFLNQNDVDSLVKDIAQAIQNTLQDETLTSENIHIVFSADIAAKTKAITRKYATNLAQPKQAAILTMPAGKPYSGANDNNLPEYIQELSEKDRRRWVAIFNSSYESCKTDGGKDCEAEAFHTANGIVKPNKKSHSRSSCMECNEPPTMDILWCEGMAHAWLCDEHYQGFVQEHGDPKDSTSDINKVLPITDGLARESMHDAKSINRMTEVRCLACHTLLAKNVIAGEFVCSKCKRDQQKVYIIEDGILSEVRPFLREEKHLPGKHDQLAHSGSRIANSIAQDSSPLESEQITNLHPLGAGRNGAQYGQVGGIDVVVKGRSRDFTKDGQSPRVEHERAAYLVSKYLDGLMPVPPTVIRNLDERQVSVQQFIHGAQTVGSLSRAQRTSPDFENQRNSLRVFDTVINFRERSPINAIYSKADQNIIAIDHAKAFSRTNMIRTGKPSDFGLTITQNHQRQLSNMLNHRNELSGSLKALNFKDDEVDALFSRAGWLMQ